MSLNSVESTALEAPNSRDPKWDFHTEIFSKISTEISSDFDSNSSNEISSEISNEIYLLMALARRYHLWIQNL